MPRVPSQERFWGLRSCDILTHLGSVGEECRLLVVQLNGLAVKVYSTGIITRLEGLVALVLEFDSHFAK